MNGINGQFYAQRAKNSQGFNRLDDNIARQIKLIIQDNEEKSATEIIDMLNYNSSIKNALKNLQIDVNRWFHKDRDTAKLEAIKHFVGFGMRTESLFSGGIVETLSNNFNQIENKTTNRVIRSKYTNKEIDRYKKQAEFFYNTEIKPKINDKSTAMFVILNHFYNRNMRHFYNRNMRHNYGKLFTNVDMAKFMNAAKDRVTRVINRIYLNKPATEKEILVNQLLEATMWINVHKNSGQVIKAIIKLFIVPLGTIMAAVVFLVILVIGVILLIISLCQHADKLPGIGKDCWELFKSITNILYDINTGDDLRDYTKTYNSIMENIEKVEPVIHKELRFENLKISKNQDGKLECPLSFCPFNEEEYRADQDYLNEWCVVAKNNKAEEYTLYYKESLSVWINLKPKNPLTNEPLNENDIIYLC